ncbi:cytochrome p450 71d8 [Quercus suber]|uniref:Cytochrome p450 71d8 n=1 Tax=Quercus suber TaxID=58331 RepID=A0AAW0JEB8_QUESU
MTLVSPSLQCIFPSYKNKHITMNQQHQGCHFGLYCTIILLIQRTIYSSRGQTIYESFQVIFAAGTDTSSTTVEWAMSEMMRQPKVLEKAQAEIRQAFRGKKKIHEKDIQNLSYLKSVIKETIRLQLHPPLPLILLRECRESCEIMDMRYPSKPKSFIPERFAFSSTEFNGTHLEYIPFEAGRRMCPGVAFGLANIELPLAQLLYHFDWELQGRTRPEELDMTEKFGSVV